MFQLNLHFLFLLLNAGKSARIFVMAIEVPLCADKKTKLLYFEIFKTILLRF